MKEAAERMAFVVVSVTWRGNLQKAPPNPMGRLGEIPLNLRGADDDH